MIVIVLALSPLMMGFQIKWLIPPSPDLDWILAIDSRTAASAETIHQPQNCFHRRAAICGWDSILHCSPAIWECPSSTTVCMLVWEWM